MSENDFECFASTGVNTPATILRIWAAAKANFFQADSQGTLSVLYGDELKPELCGLFPESVLSALYGFFVAAVKDTLVIGFPNAEQMVNNPS